MKCKICNKVCVDGICKECKNAINKNRESLGYFERKNNVQKSNTQNDFLSSEEEMMNRINKR